MADPIVTQIVADRSALAATTVTFAAQDVGTLLLLSVASDAYVTPSGAGRPESTGWTRLESFEGNLGHYLWYKISDGTETSVQYTLSTAVASAHIINAATNIEPTTPVSDQANTAPGSFTSGGTPSVTPGSGRRLAVASLATSGSGSRTMSGWTNGYIEVSEQDSGTGGYRPTIGIATLALDGGVATNTSVTLTDTVDQVSGITAIFEVGDEPTPLDTPVVTVTDETDPTTSGGSDGSITITWAAITNAVRYEVGIATGHDQTSGFTQVEDDATSPFVITGRSAGDYTVAVKAHPAV